MKFTEKIKPLIYLALSCSYICACSKTSRNNTSEDEGSPSVSPINSTETSTETSTSTGAPTDIQLDQTSITEGPAIGTQLGVLTATDPDDGDTHTFELDTVGAPESVSFSIDGNILELAEVLDYKAKNAYTIRVKVTDSTNLEFVKDFNISVTDVLIPELLLSRSGTQTLATSPLGFTDIDWASEAIDTNNMFDFGASATDIIIPEEGYYIFSSTLDWQSNAVGKRTLSFSKNTTPFAVDIALGNAASSSANQLTTVLNFDVNDIVTISANQNSGSTIDITANTFHHVSGYRLPEEVYVRATRSADQTISNITDTAMNLNLETFDSNNLHDTGVNTDRINIPSDGWYIVSANLIWEGQPGGRRTAAITLNDGSADIVAMASQQPRGAMPVANQILSVERLSSPDYITLGVYQNSGGDLDVLGTFGDAFLNLHKLSDHAGATVVSAHKSTQIISDSTTTALTWDVEVFDTKNMIDGSGDTSRLVAPTDGKYLVTANIAWEVDSTGYRQLVISKNGTDYSKVEKLALDRTYTSISALVDLEAGEYIQLFVRHNQGTDQDMANEYTSAYNTGVFKSKVTMIRLP